MTKPTDPHLSPSERLQQRTLQVFDHLTDYRIGHIWAGASNGNPKRLMDRSREWRQSQPKTLADFAGLMDALGYEIILKKKED
jgi:hypothetical protein